MPDNFIQFVKKSPTAYHATENVILSLKNYNFAELKLKEKWEIQRGGMYYIKINHSTVIGLAIGKKFKAGSGFSIIASHTDSPCLKLKPNHTFTKEGYRMINVQTYGGGIWHTWFDRDLTLAGIVSVKKNEGISSKLVHIQKPILRIPQIAIHLQRNMNENLAINTETQLIPIISLDTSKSEPPNDSLGGYKDQFIFSPRLDNLFNVYCSLEGLLSSLLSKPLEEEENIRMILCYDNEEVGSCSYQGANSSLIPNLLKNITDLLNVNYIMAIANSFLLSADQAHALNPNFSEKHENLHKITLDHGVVIKYNSNQRYATSSFSSSIIQIIAKKCGIPVQKFSIRNDMSCGTTVGPILAALIGMIVVGLNQIFFNTQILVFL
ncbi:hypothetical protein HZS_6345 [Henneguya salminicola]|nr:hypothetical protein HZS_6345 [Henneguya salminicola]